MTPCIATFTFHPYNMSLPIALSTWDAPRAALDAPLLCSQLLPKEENGSSSCCNTTCTQSTAKEACNLFTVMYSFQQREHQRIQLRWSPALLEERAPLSRSRSYFGVGYNLKAPCMPEPWLAAGSANENIWSWVFSWGVWIRRHVIMLLSILRSFSLCHPLAAVCYGLIFSPCLSHSRLWFMLHAGDIGNMS